MTDQKTICDLPLPTGEASAQPLEQEAHKVETMYWNEGGEMLSFIEDHIDLQLAARILFADQTVKECLDQPETSETDDSYPQHLWIGPKATEMKGDVDISLDEDGNKFWEVTSPYAGRARPVTGIDWGDRFV